LEDSGGARREVVKNIGREGPVVAYNEGAPMDQQVRPLDRIFSVSGTTGKAAQLKAALLEAAPADGGPWSVELGILRPLG